MYYGWVRSADVERQIELLADMLRSTLPPDEFTTEKNVILEEIAMSHDNLEHVMFDFLQEKVFAGHPLAWPILGYNHTIESLTRDQMWEYFKKRYAPNNMLLVVAGNVDPQHVIELAQTYCGDWERVEGQGGWTAPTIHTGVDVLTVDRFKQQVIAICFPAANARDEDAETAAAAATILGGDNSRFFWKIVQTGISPRAGAFHLDYSDCGLMILYGVCTPDHAPQLTDALRREAELICAEGVREDELDRVKIKRRTSLAIEAEAPYYRLTQLMDDVQYHGAPRTVEQMLAEVDAISVDRIGAYFRRYPINTAGHLTSTGPRSWPETH